MKEQILITTVRDSMVAVKKNNAAVREKNGAAVGEGYNRTTSVNSTPNQNHSPNIKQNLKTEIDLLFILSPLPIVLGLWRWVGLSYNHLFHW
jgi:hypothetical protein